jgi:Derlin-2/3
MPMARVGGVGDAIGPEQWFRSLPTITQYWFGAVVAVTLAANFGVVSPFQLLFHWQSITQRLELWRLVTCFLYLGPFSKDTVLSAYLLVSFSQKYEGGWPFNTGAGGGTADYAYYLMFATASVLLTYPLLGPLLTFRIMGIDFPLPPFFARNLVYSVLYLWSKRNSTTQANVLGVPMPGRMLPFACLGLLVVTGHPYMDLIHGSFIAHAYYFLADVVPQARGRDVLVTPQFLIKFFGIGAYRPAAPIRVVDPQQARGGPAGAAGGEGGGRYQYEWGGAGRPLGRA